MLELKPKSLFKSFRFKILLLIILLFCVIILSIIKFKFLSEDKTKHSLKFTSESNEDNSIDINYNLLRDKFERDIDSILNNFSIKKAWITTQHAEDKPIKPKQEKTKKEPVNAQWFIKNVIIPKDIISAELNLDLSSYLNSTGLKLLVREDIKTSDLNMNIYPPNDTTMSTVPYALINIIHSDKVQRETGTYVIILNNIWEFKQDEINDLLTRTNEFSFIFPRNMEQIELQNELVRTKKDVLINLTIGEKNKTETDFNMEGDDKEMKQKIRSFTSDFPYIKTVFITRTDTSIAKSKIFSKITEEFIKYDVRIIPDTMVTSLNSTEDDSKNLANLVLNRMKSKITNKGILIGLVSLSYEEFKSFYDEVSMLKKAGYKFYNLSQYLTKEDERKKKDLLKQQKEVTLDKNRKNTEQKKTAKKK